MLALFTKASFFLFLIPRFYIFINMFIFQRLFIFVSIFTFLFNLFLIYSNVNENALTQ